MSITASIWLVIVAGFVAANIPFLNQRFFAVGPKGGAGSKPLWIRLACALHNGMATFAEAAVAQRSDAP